MNAAATRISPITAAITSRRAILTTAQSIGQLVPRGLSGSLRYGGGHFKDLKLPPDLKATLDDIGHQYRFGDAARRKPPHPPSPRGPEPARRYERKKGRPNT